MLKGFASSTQLLKVFDWYKAARLIKESGYLNASAGLREDWEYTGGFIFKDGKIVPSEETYTYLASMWAVPELNIDGHFYECWIWQKDSPGWNAETYWPESAYKILIKKD